MPKKAQIEKYQIGILFWKIFLYSLTLFLGTLTAFKINETFKIQNVSTYSLRPLEFIFLFIIGTVFILAVSFFIKSGARKGKIFKLLFIFAAFWGGLMLLDVWLASLYWIGSTLAFILMCLLVFLWIKKSSILIHDICMVLGIAGAGAIVGLKLDPVTVVFLLVIFSFYDFIAVYRTKHMIKMTREMIAHQAVLAFVIPQKISGFKEKLEEVKPGGKFLVLGGGDVAFPLFLCVALVPQSVFHSLLVGIFSVVGILFSFCVFLCEKKKPIPALPPIAFFSALGFLVTFFL